MGRNPLFTPEQVLALKNLSSIASRTKKVAAINKLSKEWKMNVGTISNKIGKLNRKAVVVKAPKVDVVEEISVGTGEEIASGITHDTEKRMITIHLDGKNIVKTGTNGKLYTVKY